MGKGQVVIARFIVNGSRESRTYVVKKQVQAKSLEDSASWFSYTFFLYLTSIFEKGESLEHADLGPTSVQDRCQYLYERFQKYWEQEKKLPAEKRSLWKVLWRTSGYEQLLVGLGLYCVYQAESFGPILILNYLVKYFEGTQELSQSDLSLLVALIFILPMTGSIFAAHSNAIFAHVGMQFRNILITMIYRKSLRLSPAAKQISSTGQIINMFSNDTQQLQRFLYFFNNMAIALPTIAVCLWLIYDQLNVATFVGLGMILIMMPMNGLIFGLLNAIRRKKVLITDIRVKLMNEILSGIRIIKYYAWEKAFAEKVSMVRKRELELLKLAAYIVAIAFTLVLQAVPTFMPVLIFYVYVKLGNTLDAARAFTSIALFNLMQFPFVFLPMGFSQYSQSLVSCNRILEFLDADELIPYVDRSPGENGVIVEMQGANLGWVLADDGKAKNSTLRDSKITLEAIETQAANNPKKIATLSKEGKQYNKLVAEGERDEESGNAVKVTSLAEIELTDLQETEKESNLINRSINTLRNVSFRVKQGELVAVIGSVGSGKSSILSALLGEMLLHRGSVRVFGDISYCDQRPWILNDTVQGNILFGKPYDEAKFDAALYAANLEDDIKVLPGGINTQIGERGINLSGGQKARVALARAVYQDTDVYLLDDPLSAVDAHVGQFIFHECVSKALKGKTRILVTHHVHYLPQCDQILLLHEGEVKFFGTYEQLSLSGLDLSSFVNKKEEEEDAEADREQKEGGKDSDTEGRALSSQKLKQSELAKSNYELMLSEGEEVEESVLEVIEESKEEGQLTKEDQLVPHEPSASNRSDPDGSRNRKPSVSSSRRDDAMKAKEAAIERKKDNRTADLITKEERQIGNVNLSVYSYYVKAGGVFWFSSMCFFVIIGQLFQLLGAYWLQWWGTISIRREFEGDPLDTERNVYFLDVYAGLAAVSLVAFCLRSIILAKHRLRTSSILHNELLSATLDAPIAFFDTTPVGRILNRFSSDLVVVDEELTQTISQLSNSVAQVLGAIGAIAGSTKGTFLVLFVPLVFIYDRFQRYFRAGNTTVARLESVSRSPIYADFSQALAGANSIRAFKQEKRFVEELERALDKNSVANIFLQLSTQWLAIRLDFIGSLVSFFIALLAVTATDFIPAGYVAVGLSYSFQLTTYMKFLVRFAATGEAQMNSVERIKFYMDNIPKEGLPDREIDPTSLPEAWPEKGTIVAKDLQLRYRDGPLVLKGINFAIADKEKIGVAGRTGSGKSSLMVALFRIQELANGSIFIDNVDISTLPLRLLRKKLGIIPQDPVMFSASIRFNLDPFREFQEKDLWEVLESVNIKDHVLSLPNKLEEEVSEGGDNFSAGQRQLICIARAILRKPKILVLDEATASIDNETDNLIQAMIRKEFSQCTVLTIAHRLNTIIDSDRVMVLDQGNLMELDSPNELLVKSNGAFRSLWERHLKSHGNSD